VIVGHAELDQVAIGVLEVVAGDLLELRCAVTIDPIGPLHEALVQRRARTLQQPVVGAVPDQDVIEAVEAARLGADELLPHQFVESRRDLVSDELFHQLLHCGLLEEVPDYRRGVDHGTLLALEGIESGSQERLDCGRHPALRQLVGTPNPVLEQ